MAEAAETTATPTRTAANVRRANGSAAPRRRVARVKADDLEAQVEQLQADLRSITHTISRMGELGVDEVKTRAKNTAQHVVHSGQSAVETAQDEFSQFEKQIKDSIRDKPLTAVAGAIALGWVLAAVTR
jgi:ElaB/YqjD/DUF883 family membrane-anchored ribosome-binding protein